MDSVPFWLPFAFVAIALVYSAAGFGGGSAYLAVMAVSGLSYVAIPQIALLCNVIVSGGGTWHFHRGGHLDWKRMLPFIALSIPMAYVGGRLQIGKEQFYIVVGLSLLLAGIRMLFPNIGDRTRRSITGGRAWLIGLPVGAGLGLLSGVVGIGGGIFLAPILLLTGWTNVKQTAAAASVFILVNSLAGLAGQLVKGVYLDVMVIPLALAALVGGQIGSRAGSNYLPAIGVRRLLAAIIVVVGVRLLWKAL